MKRFILFICTIIAVAGCKNSDTTFPDFEYTSGYFPYQFPVRTLVLGDDIYDNTNDNAHRFVISVAMGGVYENNKNRVFEFEVDESLCDQVVFAGTEDPIRALPRAYYTLSSESQITIPKGEMNGGITVQLTDAFFEDANAIGLNYVVPIRLTGANDVDTILNGRSSRPDADIRFAGDWDEAPKNFTMFGIKYINEFHGTYFHYGDCTVKDGSGATVEQHTYSADYVEQNATAKLVTTGRYQTSVSVPFQSELMEGTLNLMLDFEGSTCTVSAPEGSAFTVSGTGEFKKDAYSWGNKTRHGIEVTYTVSDGTHTYEANDTFVVRDRGVVMEVFTPQAL
ncbi:BT_3987 domain-containing protein [Parapedobacter sp. 10938]|uniref:BT_3987 domain-containing protein n=1 Tax=Parapedobacter flavus TaxID=3110225 RepID=UPI002DBFD40E|nr:DUF5627 domain-containing protein [Parapedobacter sp. 10938]MEC3879963.1 DUF5627 domain-containing protein [Parapedobacter sp. 10938]